MGYKNNCFCTAWENKATNKVINKYEKYAEVQLSTSKKVDGQYKNDWSDKVRFVGKAFEKIKDIELAEKDKIKLLEVEVTNKYDKERKLTYTNYVCWDFECIDTPKQSAPQQPEVVGEITPLDDMFDDNLSGLPF